MESPSDPAHRGCVPWQGLLLTASLLTFWSLPTTAKLTIESVPPSVLEGKDVLFRVHNLPGNGAAYTWCKGESSNKRFQIVFYQIITKQITFGPLSRKKETIYPNGSLLLRDVTVQETGYYNLLFTQKSFEIHAAAVHLQVYSLLPKPSLKSKSSNPEEHKEHVVLMCEIQTQNITPRWFFNHQSLPASARLQLSKDNRTLTLISVTRNDTGSYECEIWNPLIANRSDPFALNVLYGPDAPNISPSDSYYLRGINLSLSCHAVSNPPAQYSWFINGISQNTTQELFIPNITVNNSGSYVCLAQNSITFLKRIMLKTITVYGTGVCDEGEWVNWPQYSQIMSPTHTRAPLRPGCMEMGSESATGEPSELCPGSEVTSCTTLCDTSAGVIAEESSEQCPYLTKPVGKPAVRASNATVRENEDTVILTCLTDDTEISTRWFFKNQGLLLTDKIKLSQDNSTLTIKPIRRDNAGDYQCEVFNPASSRKSDPFKLDVQYDATLSPRLSDRAIGGVVTGLLAGVALIAALMFFMYTRKTRRARDQRDLQNKPSASKRSQGHSENPPSKMDEITYSSVDFNAQESQKPTYASPFPTATETVYSET